MKIAVLIVFTLEFLYQIFLLLIERNSFKNPIPDIVKDVYDTESYSKWLAYSEEKLRLRIIENAVGFAANLLLLGSNVYAAVAGLWSGSIYSELIIVVLFYTLVETLVDLGFVYYDSMVIEEKYGFNRTTKKTFFADQIKEFIISFLLMALLTSALAAIHTAVGDWLAVLFAAVLFLFVLGITFLYPFFSRIFNRFTDLEDGELKNKLTALLEKNGYTVRGIKVMDASRRSTKSNAYFSGFGKMKTIVLYDTMLNRMTTDEICAVFAHEMGHGLHRDTLKMQAMSFLNVLLLSLVLWITVRTENFCTAFGFEHMNYAFAVILATTVGFEIIAPLFNLLSASYSRMAEYRADEQAAKEGYGEQLISALKKLTRENFLQLSPSPLLVKLTYSHPTLVQRIEAIQKK